VLVEGYQLYFITNNTDGGVNPEAEDDQLMKVDLNELHLWLFHSL